MRTHHAPSGSPTIPTSRRQPHPTPRDLRWLALAGAGGAALAATGVANGGIVQITQSNIHAGGNILIDNDPSNFFRDLTGDGNANLPLLLWITKASSSLASLASSLATAFAGRFAFGNGSQLSRRIYDQVGTRATSVSSTGPGPPPSTPTAIIDITFQDSRINSNQATTGLMEIRATSVAGAGNSSVEITRFIFDDASTSFPSAGDLLNTTVLGTTYPEFAAAAVPEPADVNIFALGAAGILLHRRRRKAAKA